MQQKIKKIKNQEELNNDSQVQENDSQVQQYNFYEVKQQEELNNDSQEVPIQQKTPEQKKKEAIGNIVNLYNVAVLISQGKPSCEKALKTFLAQDMFKSASDADKTKLSKAFKECIVLITVK